MSQFEYTNATTIELKPIVSGGELTIRAVDATGAYLYLCNDDRLVDRITVTGAYTVTIKVYDDGAQYMDVYSKGSATKWSRTTGANYSSTTITVPTTSGDADWLAFFVEAYNVQVIQKSQVIIVRRSSP